MTDLTGSLTFAGRKWGRGHNERFDFLRSPVDVIDLVTGRRANPIACFRHGGFGITGNMSTVWPHGVGWHNLIEYTRTRSDIHLDWVSFESPERGFSTFKRSKQEFFPGYALGVQRAICGIKAQHRELGIDPDRMALAGFSFGAHASMLSQALTPMRHDGQRAERLGRLVDGRGFDSRVRCLINDAGSIDVRRRNAPNGVTYVGAAWDEATKQVRKIGAFVAYRLVAGDRTLIRANAGGATGLFAVAARISDDAVELATSPGAASSALDGWMPTDSQQFTYCTAWFGTDRNDPAGWDAISRDLKAAASPMHYLGWSAETGQIEADLRAQATHFVPTWNLYPENVGNGIIPYQGPSAGSEVHDPQQGRDIDLALRCLGLESHLSYYSFGTGPPNSFDDQPSAVMLIYQPITDWLVSKLA